MWNRGFSAIGLVAMGSLLGTSDYAWAGEWVNVKAQWCGNTCSEGHDDAACLCEYNSGQSPSSPYSWNNCTGVPCCVWTSTYCSVGDPDCLCLMENGRDARMMREWCSPYSPIITCTSWYASASYSCDYDCTYESDCQISYPTSSPNWVFINGSAGQQCTGENETGFWSVAAWLSFLGSDTCTLNQQSPWDDFPLENEVCE